MVSKTLPKQNKRGGKDIVLTLGLGIFSNKEKLYTNEMFKPKYTN